MYGQDRASTRSSSYLHEEMKYTRAGDSISRDDTKYMSQDSRDSRYHQQETTDFPAVFDRIESVQQVIVAPRQSSPPLIALPLLS